MENVCLYTQELSKYWVKILNHFENGYINKAFSKVKLTSELEEMVMLRYILETRTSGLRYKL